jgi:hypothetical protein
MAPKYGPVHFWEIRSTLGKDVTDRLLLKTWKELKPEEVLPDRGAAFARKLAEAAGEQNGPKIRTVFARRGLSF